MDFVAPGVSRRVALSVPGSAGCAGLEPSIVVSLTFSVDVLVDGIGLRCLLLSDFAIVPQSLGKFARA